MSVFDHDEEMNIFDEQGDRDPDYEPLEPFEEALAEEIKKLENADQMYDLRRVSDVVAVSRVMKAYGRKTGAKMKYEIGKTFKTTGSVTLTGRSISIKDPGGLLKAASLSSNVEIYPKTDGTVCVAFTFNDMTIPLDGE